MHKLQYIIRGEAGKSRASFAAEILGPWVNKTLEMKPAGLTIHVTRPARPRLSVIPFRKEPLAVTSIWESDPDRNDHWTDLMTDAPGQVSGYRVRESTPQAYRRTWDDGRRTPGVGLLTLLNGNPSLSYDAFMTEWFGKHTPMSLRIHPLWNYVRNVVEGEVVPRSPRFDGIVEEHFRTDSDLLNPVRFFGGPIWMAANMVRVGLHVRKFLDLSSLQTFLVDEYHFKTRR